MMKSYTWSSAGSAAEPLAGDALAGPPALALPDAGACAEPAADPTFAPALAPALSLSVAPAAPTVGIGCAALEPLPVADPTFAPAPPATGASSALAAALAFAGFEAAADPAAAALAARIRSMSARTLPSATPINFRKSR